MSKYGGNTEFYNKIQTSSLSIKDVFSDVFKKHQKSDGEKLFLAGTSTTTPSETMMLQEWRKPWVFMRVLAVGLLLFLLLCIMESMGYGMFTLVLQVLTGAAIIPLAVLLFYWEMNIPRNIPLYQILFVILIGGALSLIFTILLNEAFASDNAPAQYAAFVEEPAKLAAVCIFLHKPKYRYTLNGILIGGAIGCGFAIIETTGYYLGYGGDTLLVRGILAPGGHVLYAALYAGALAGIKKSERLRAKHFANIKFSGFFAAAVILHFINNDSSIQIFLIPAIGDVKYLILLAVGWTILLMLIKTGINEILAATLATKPTARSVRTPVLHGLCGMYTGQSITLAEGSIVFGRNPADCNLLFPSDTSGISRKHCTLSYDGQAVWLCDENSSNGTFLWNGERLKPGSRIQIKPGERFYLATTKTMFELRQS